MINERIEELLSKCNYVTDGTFEVTCPPRAGGEATMSETKVELPDAVAGQVDRGVRPSGRRG
jgi:hypothetical protein